MTVVRPVASGDAEAIEGLYRSTFPDEDLVPLVRDLLALGERDVLSLVAVDEAGQIAGHVAFTLAGVEGGSQRLALLAPLAVAPAFQRRGIGTALVRDGFDRLRDAGVVRVFTLGDPAYYGRYGFRAEMGVTPPYELPDEWQGAWQSVALADGDPPRGGIQLPDLWLRPALWMP